MELMLNHIFPIELWMIIRDYTDSLSQINLTMVCKFLNKNLQITDLYNIDPKYQELLTNDILKKYPYITKLKLRWNTSVTDINHLSKLEILDATGGWMQSIYVPDCGYCLDEEENLFNNCGGICILSDKGIRKLTNLRNIDISCNRNITSLNHCKKLKVLTARSYSGLTNEGISKLYNLEDVDLTDNQKINRIDHLKKLRVLNISGINSVVNNNDIKNLNLYALDATNNSTIDDINHMNKLKILIANGPFCDLSTESINKLKLKVIFADSNNKIKQSQLTHMTSIVKFIQELEYEIYEYYF